MRGLPCGQRLILEETSAPYGFACSEKIVFELDEDGRVYVYDEEGDRHAVQDATVTMEDELVKGRLSWQKTGSLYQRNEKQESERRADRHLRCRGHHGGRRDLCEAG